LQRDRLGDLRVPAQHGAVLPGRERVGLGDGGRGPCRAPAEQVFVEVFAERAADQVQRDRVHARVDETQTEPDDAQNVPERVVLVRGLGVVVKPQHEHVLRQKADGEHQHEREHGFRHFLTSAHLADLSLRTRFVLK